MNNASRMQEIAVDVHEHVPFGELVRNVSDRVAELETALAARDEFIAVLGHELRNQVAPLVLLASSSTASGTPTAGSMRVDLLARLLQKLTATLDRVAEVSQLRQGKLQCVPYESISRRSPRTPPSASRRKRVSARASFTSARA